MPIYAQLLHSSERRLRGVGIDTARLDAEMLLALAAGLGRTGLYGQLHISASSDVETHFAALLDRRARREPIAYITGVQEFWSLSFAVTPAVLVPRPETELLVELARRSVDPDQVGSGAESDGRWICDVGTGSGCIAVALAQELPDARVVAVDVLPPRLPWRRATPPSMVSPIGSTASRAICSTGSTRRRAST